MHEAATLLLVATSSGKAITPYDYDNFANTLERMRLEIFAMRHELEGLFYNRDPLTNAINRVDMLPILREQQELVKHKITQSCCLVMMDLDHFKNTNDQHGHLAGDKVLAASAHYIIENLRPYDKVFRYGGEEFLICMQNIDLKGALEILERIREGLAKLDINIGEEKPTHITASFGLTLLEPDTPIEQSIDRADKAAYAAKAANRNCVRTWEPNK